MPKAKRSDAQYAADDIAARRALLGLWLDRLRDAESLNQRQRGKVGRGDIPDLTMPYPSRDMLDLLVSGIRAALSGSVDPFGIRPKRGVRLRRDLSKADRIEAIQEVARRAKTGKVTDAITAVAAEKKVSYGTLRKCYYDKSMRQLAGLEKLNPLWEESNRRLSSKTAEIDGKT